MKFEDCFVCGKTFNRMGIAKHLKWHGIEFYQEWKEKSIKVHFWIDKSFFKIVAGEFNCVECQFKTNTVKSVRAHYWRKHTIQGINFEEKLKICPPIRKNFVPWNKGLTKESDARIKKSSETLSNTIKQQQKNGNYTPRRMGLNARLELSERQSLHNSGGRCKWYDVDGVKVQGTWEYNIALKLNELNVKWTKPKVNNDIWKYEIDGLIKSYSPDFYLPEYDQWLELKGYWWGNDLEKMKIINATYPERKLLIVEEDGYKKILDGNLIWI